MPAARVPTAPRNWRRVDLDCVLIFADAGEVMSQRAQDHNHELAMEYPGVQVVPRGHHVLAASACVASQSETLCPMLEYLVKSRISFQPCHTRPLVAEAGTFAMPHEPGLGPSLEEQRMERV